MAAKVKPGKASKLAKSPKVIQKKKPEESPKPVEAVKPEKTEKPAAKPANKLVAKPANKPVAKPANKPIAKPANNPTAKPANSPKSAKSPKPAQEDAKSPKPKVEQHKPNPESMARTVFVGNLKVSEKRKTIEKLFKPYGEIEACYKRSLLGKTEKLTKKMFGTDEKLNKSVRDSFFFVRFVKAEDAQKALELNGTELEGRIIRVTLSNKKQVDSSKSVFVGNLRREVTEQQLYDFVKEKMGAPESTRIVHDKFSGFGKGIGFITFKDSSQVPLALKLDGQPLKGRPVRITKIAKKNQRPVADPKDQKKKAQKTAKKQEENSLKQKLANYTITKKTQIATTAAKKIPKKVKKVIQKKKQKKTKSLMA
ncbi:unnamed protein product [Bursaphelenchus okinawaensis]|uniref:RRM domain-containing protein n=1 Tax=Bursaphelenchus okinawaensis TaxID=465554 RepID=A0A811KYV1_9BILA|nr:unnamed protein product [Bursaphelenchus okinawaensis]CAG9114786.1 unnamed protein product [Bursaphelenchus okinawaensis]